MNGYCCKQENQEWIYLRVLNFGCIVSNNMYITRDLIITVSTFFKTDSQQSFYSSLQSSHCSTHSYFGTISTSSYKVFCQPQQFLFITFVLPKVYAIRITFTSLLFSFGGCFLPYYHGGYGFKDIKYFSKKNQNPKYILNSSLGSCTWSRESMYTVP